MTAAALDEDIVLPDPTPPPPRPALPIVASIVPVAAALGLWAVTGSILSLWFAALGPLIAVATLVDGARTARRSRRRQAAEGAAARAAARSEVDRRHSDERAALDRRHPDAAAYAGGDVDTWRGDGELLVLGRGPVPSAVAVRGGRGDDAARAVRAHAAVLTDAPVTVPARGAIAIAGPPATAEAVVRALALQLCAALPPTALRVAGRVPDGHWSARLPHRRGAGVRTLHLGAAGAPRDPADLALVTLEHDAAAPPGAGVVVRMTSPVQGELGTPDGPRPIDLEALSAEQAAVFVEELATRADRLHGGEVVAVGFADLAGADTSPGLAAAIGVEDGHPAVVDLVADGPHAIVVGVTGAGKSELLATWVAALCRDRDPDAVAVLLADFKGGATFEGLRALPHVVGVITDLDDAGARRAIESLRAEIRRREGALTAAGVRDAADPRSGLGRLVVVVDEFAALLAAHPELQGVFADVAARGRALGMHLLLGTQRATGVVREGLLANCPLRVALRVTDVADARLVVGAADPAALPGDAASRGLAYIRRAGDAQPRLTRIALTTSADVATIAARADRPPTASPWLPPLPERIGLDDLDAFARRPGDLVLGLADDPSAQRRRLVSLGPHDRGILALGGAGAGKTAFADLVARQVASRALVRVPRDPEAAWDAVAALAASPPPPGLVVVIDDADALPTRFPADHGRELADRLERLARDAGDLGIRLVVTAQRPLGLAGRLGELLPRRLVLGTASRADHVAAGGDPSLYRARAVPGRGTLDGLEVQVAWADGAPPTAAPAEAAWEPGRLTGLVLREGTASVLAACRDLGVAARPLEEVALDERPPVGPLVVWGEPESWQRHWRLLALVRADGELVVDAGCASDLRTLTGARGLPPYCRPGAGRAWRIDPDGALERIVLPGRRPPGRREVDP